MQSPERSFTPILTGQDQKQDQAPKQNHKQHHKHPVHALLCSALILPGFWAMQDLALAHNAANNTAYDAVQEAQQKPMPKPVQTVSETAQTGQTGQTAPTDGPACTDGPAGTKVPDGPEEPKETGLYLPSITDFAPGSVYSGTLGELTRLQAGQEMARATLSLKEIQARILEVENSMAKARRELSEAKAAEESGSKASLQEAMDTLRAGLESLAEDVAALRTEKAQALDKQCLVLSVRSQGSRLMAELATKEGRFLAGAGDKVPGVGRIDSVSRTRVTAEGRSLPWK